MRSTARWCRPETGPKGRVVRRCAVLIAAAVLATALVAAVRASAVSAGTDATLAANTTRAFSSATPPILVVHSAAAPDFGSYLPEILRTEGLADFAVTDLSSLTAATLADYQVVILGEMALTDAQVSILTAWVGAAAS